MSSMHLRSSRSRSKTPFSSQELIDNEIIESGNNHVEKTVTRSTRSTTIYKTSENLATSSEEFSETSYQTKPAKKSSSRSLRSRVLKTSDYSSEEGDDEVTSTKTTISQNEKNQLLEEARRTENGRSDSPALELYRKSGRYWDVYPKTDWTYSQHSKDRVEIAPGVVAMPNMSRRTIHPLDETTVYSDHVAHKNINTDTTYVSRTTENIKKNLFNNNEDYYIKRRTVTRWSTFKQTIITIFLSVVSVITYAFRYQTSCFAYVHHLAARVMLLDTWLLWKTKPGDKAKKLVLLCLVPLFLFGGWWLISSLGSLVLGTYSNFTFPGEIMSFSSQESIAILPSPLNDRQEREAPNQNFNQFNEKFDSTGNSIYNSETANQKIEERIVKITEKIYMEPPSAGEIANNLSEEQLKIISKAIKNSLNLEVNEHSNINIEEIVQQVVDNPSFHTIINNFNEYNVKAITNTESKDNAEILSKHQSLIDSLIKEIYNMKQEMLLNDRLRRQAYSNLAFDIKKCCNRPQINIESYVTRIVTDLLNNPEFLNGQRGLNNWLRALFIAKTDLEYHLGNLTANMDSKMADLVQENSQILMDNVAIKLTEINKKYTNVEYQRSGDIQNSGSLINEQIKNIVKEAIAIYDADKTGLVDYAMETMGGQILTTRCTENYHYGKAVVSVLGIPLWYPTNSPRTVITPGVNPGECWAFQNFPGFLVIKLSSTIKVDAFSMEHISKLLVPEGKIDSAPKEFEVYGLKSENDKEPVKLGTYIFDNEGNTIQYFLVDDSNQVFDLIELRILSNHGNPNYTCLYRFRVHGKLHHDEVR